MTTPALPPGFVVESQRPQIPPGFQIERAQNAGPQPISSINDPRGAVATVASSIPALPVSGIAGLFGLAGGLVPGGESPMDKAARFQRATQDALTIDPPNQASEKTLEAVGKVGQKVSDLGTAAGAAFASFSPEEESTANIHDAPERRQAQEERFNAIRQEGLGNSINEATGSPALATLFDTAPTALGGIFALRNAAIRGVDTPEPPTRPRPSFDSPDGPQVSVGRPRLDEAADLTPQSVKIANDLRKNKPKKVAEQILPDARTLAAAERLGISLNPEHYSTNAAFMEVMRSIKAKGGSNLQANEVVALRALSDRADNLIDELGGSIDKSSVSDDILSQTRDTIDDLQNQARVEYGRVNNAIPRATVVDTSDLSAYLNTKLGEVAGRAEFLSSAERQLLNLVKRDKKNPDGVVTYAALDRVRRDVGNGFNKRSGPFADDDDAILREVYGQLSDVQNGVADAFGVGDIYANARSLVATRKGLEDQAVNMFGRNMSGSLAPKIRSSASALIRGDVSHFRRLMDALPEARRSEVAATVIGDVFAAGSRRGGELGTGFVGNFQALNRNRQAKDLLFSYLTPEGRQRFDDIGRVMTGIVRSNQKSLANPSGTASAVVDALESGTIVERLYDLTKKGIAAEGASASVGVPGAGIAGVIGGTISRSKTPGVVAADRLLTSPEFDRAISAAIAGDRTRAETIITSSPRYKVWTEMLDENSAREVAETGFITYLTAANDQ